MGTISPSSDLDINYTTKTIEVKHQRHTINELYSSLMQTFDESSQMDDLIPMIAKTPTLYELINGWRISTLSWDFLHNSAVTETRGGTQNWNIWTNVRSLGAIETGTRLHIQQGTIVTFEAYWPFCLQNTLGPTSSVAVVSSTIPASVSSSGSLRVGVWLGTDEYLGYSSWSNGQYGTFNISVGGINDHSTLEVARAPHEGHFDICLQTKLDNSEIDSQNFKTYCRKFQKTYSDFTTTGGGIVSNVPLASAADPFLTIEASQCLTWENTITVEWQASNVKRSAFDGTLNEQEYALQYDIDASTLKVVTSNTLAALVPSSGYFQVENEVFSYSSWVNGQYGTFTVNQRGTFDTAAASHLAGRDLSTAMFEYNLLVQSSNSAITLLQIYNFVQYELLAHYDIADDSSVHYGWITSPLVEYTGAMWTKQGIWVEGFVSTDRSNIKYRDVNNILHTPPTYITLKIDADAAMSGGRGAMYKLSTAYDPNNYTIIATLIDAILDSNGDASTSIKYQADWYLLARTRKAGRLPYETGYSMSGAKDVTILAANPEDTIYSA